MSDADTKNAQASSSTLSPMCTKFPELKGLMEGNRKWATKCGEDMPDLLPKLAKGQILWIGCVDSRVPETLITASNPGDIFVHRNIANQFQRDDPSANAVLEYALGVVGCTHGKNNDLNSYHLAILYSLCFPLLACSAHYPSLLGRADIPVIVVGHTGCGGAIASFAQPPPTASDADPSAKPDTHLMQFLDPLIRFRHTLPEGSDVNDLIRENIKDGVGNLVVSPAVKTAWGAGKDIWIHGWMFDIEKGLLHDLECSVGPNGAQKE